MVSADFDYVTLHIGGRPVAGIHGVGNALPRDRGPHWLTYFEVADTDEAADRVIELGGPCPQARPRHPARPRGHGGRPGGREVRGGAHGTPNRRLGPSHGRVIPG